MALKEFTRKGSGEKAKVLVCMNHGHQKTIPIDIFNKPLAIEKLRKENHPV